MSRADSRSAKRNVWLLSCLLLALAWALAQLAAGPPPTGAADPIDAVIVLSDRRVVESSGLAKSNRIPGGFWTHNDSGHSARLFAFDERGVATGGCTLEGVEAIDFEDIASYVQDGAARLLVADVGDNRARRSYISLYCLDEPDPGAQSAVKNWFRLDLRYPDGPRDCEAVAVDVAAGKVTLVSKRFFPHASIYEIELPARNAVHGPQPPIETLRLVGHLPLSLVTAMDRDETSGDTLLVNYFQLFRFPNLGPDRNWWEQTPRATDLPKLKQIEAVAVDHAGAIWVTSEGSPAPLARVYEETEPAE